MKKWLRRCLWLVLAVLLGVGVAIGLLLGTERGNQWLVRQVLTRLSIQADHIQGTLWHGLQLKGLYYQRPHLRMSDDEAVVKVGFWPLFRGVVEVEQLQIQGLSIQTTSNPDAVPDKASSPLRFPRLPITLQLAQVDLQHIHIQHDQQVFTLEHVNVPQFEWSKHRFYLHLARVQVQHQADQLIVAGTVNMQLNALLQSQPQNLQVDLQVLSPSTIHGQSVSGVVQTELTQLLDLTRLQAHKTNIDLHVGPSYVKMQGDYDQRQSQMYLAVHVQKMAALSGQLDLNAHISGNMPNHTVQFQTRYVPQDQKDPFVFFGRIRGSWQQDRFMRHYAGQLADMKLLYKGLSLRQQAPMAMTMAIDPHQQITWNNNAFQGQVTVGSLHGPLIVDYIRYADRQWEAQGRFAKVKLSPEIIRYLKDTLTTWKVSSKSLQAPAVELSGQWHLLWGKSRQFTLDVQRDQPRQKFWPFKASDVPLDFDYIKVRFNDAKPMRLSWDMSGKQSFFNGKVDFNEHYYPLLGQLALKLPDRSSLAAQFSFGRSIVANITTHQLKLGSLSFGYLPASVLNMQAKMALHKTSHQSYWQRFTLSADVLANSVWNGQKLSGHMDVQTQWGQEQDWLQRLLHMQFHSQTQVQIGKAQLSLNGAIAPDQQLSWKVHIPHTKDLWPKGDWQLFTQGQIKGTLLDHQIQGSLRTEVDQKPLQMTLDSTGVVQKTWKFDLHQLQVDFATLHLHVGAHVDYDWRQEQWSLEFPRLVLTLPDRQQLAFQGVQVHGKGRQWQTRGALNKVVVNETLLTTIKQWLPTNHESQHGRLIVRQSVHYPNNLSLALNWNMAYHQALSGQAIIRRLGGDLVNPSSGLPMHLTILDLQANATPRIGSNSILGLTLHVGTQDLGYAQAQMLIPLTGLRPRLYPGSSFNIHGNIPNIAWLSPYTNNLLNLSGQLRFGLSGASTARQSWTTYGFAQGQQLDVVQVENGIRLLHGQLKARLINNQLLLDTLRFPSDVRIEPKDFVMRQWLKQHQDWKKGFLSLTGQWDLLRQQGKMQLQMNHFPLIQRSDRFLLLSNNTTIKAQMPVVDIQGSTAVDAGWASIDLQSNIPKLDSDVVIAHPGQASRSTALQLDMHMNIAMGTHFHVTGYGLDSGIRGVLDLQQSNQRLTADGVLDAYHGTINVYGQQLQVTRGNITFQGPVDNPLLDIEALRNNVEVRAGVQVTGTAQQPVIKLVSIPEVSEMEKLSWLILGRPPSDNNGADLGVLLTLGIGGTLLSPNANQEPFYRKIGLDDLAIRAGRVGHTDSILPLQTIASGDYQANNEESNNNFLVATKRLGKDFSISIEQALGGTGTVLLGSYQFMRHLSAHLKVGAVTELQLMYQRTFKH